VRDEDYKWMITYKCFDNRGSNPRAYTGHTAVVHTNLHPIKWRRRFLEEHKQWEGCHILFAIQSEDSSEGCGE
jgi:hypothetical protein